MTITRKKLIEVALPLEAINKASAREKSIRHGHPSTLHLWWARRPLAAARAVIFAQLVDDPSSLPDLFPTEKAIQKERKRLFAIIEDLVKWENSTNEEVLERAHAEIWQSWRRACADNADHPRAKDLFDRYKLPAFHDPFSGGGAIPLEAQRLGLRASASDLNPVAVLINKAMIEIPQKFAGRPPINPMSRADRSGGLRHWSGAQGLAEDVRHYGQWIRDEAEKRIGSLYPKVEITPAMAATRPDLKPLIGRKVTVIAWLWARTVKSSNPAFADVDVPLASTFMLSTKVGKEAYIEPVVENARYRFDVKVGVPPDPETTKRGTKIGRGPNFQCLMSRSPLTGDYVKSEARSGRMGARVMAIVAEGQGRRVYLSPTAESELAAAAAVPLWKPDTPLPERALGFSVQLYFNNGKFSDLFTNRQLLMLNTYSDLVRETKQRIVQEAASSGLHVDDQQLSAGGAGALAYGEAISTYLAFAVDKVADYSSTLVLWSPTRDQAKTTFARNALPLAWDFSEVNVFAGSAGDFRISLDGISRAIEAFGISGEGAAVQGDAQNQTLSTDKIVSTDPPYFDNIGYADLSDFFYSWLRPTLRDAFPDLLATLAVPKAEELVATPGRHGGRAGAEEFFVAGMTRAMHRLATQVHPAFPITIYYAFRQTESESDGTASTGWEAFLEAVIEAGLSTQGTWPIRTEREGRSRDIKSNALASSVVLVCRPRPANAPTATRLEFMNQLKARLPAAVMDLQRGNIAPVDLAQAAIGPGMAVYTSYSDVLDAQGERLSVRQALALINQALDEVLTEQEGDFDADSRWALAWFEQFGFGEGDYGVAETLSKAKNNSVGGLAAAGIVASSRGKVRLLQPRELPADWDPDTDTRLRDWEVVHHLIRVLEFEGEAAAGTLVAKLGGKAQIARELCYRLYTLCERKKRASEALSYNALVQSWPEILRLALAMAAAIRPAQADLLELL